MANDMVSSNLDDFLDDTKPKGGRGGGRLKSWKKNIDEKHGQLTAWLARWFMPKKLWTHQQVYNVVEVKEEGSSEPVLKVYSRRFNCHEGPVKKRVGKDEVSLASLQRWRNEDGTAEHSPTVCPMCILTSVVARLVAEGKIGFADVVFEWRGTEDVVQIRAGGIYGHFRKTRGLTKAQQVAMRKAGARQSEAYKEDMRPQLKYGLLLVDDANVDKGLVTAIESEALGDKIRAAIITEGKKVEQMTKIDMRDDRVRGRWDPSINPYPFFVEYDDTKDYEDKYRVTPLVGQEMGDDIRALVVDGEAPDLSDFELGDCWTLRAELQSHAKVDLPWDEIFGPAEKAGLMVPPGESKSEVDEDDGEEERAPEVNGTAGTKQEEAQAGAKEEPKPIQIGPDHPAWKNKAYKPEPRHKGAEIHLLPPNGVQDVDIDRVVKLFKAIAASVAEIVACEHCNGEMLTTDPACPTCGSEYDDDGQLKSRPCKLEGCSGLVPLTDDPGGTPEGEPVKYICPSCASIYIEDAVTGEWTLHAAGGLRTQSPRRRRAAAK